MARQGRPSSPMLARPGTSTHQVSTMIMLTMSTMIQTGKCPSHLASLALVTPTTETPPSMTPVVV